MVINIIREKRNPIIVSQKTIKPALYKVVPLMFVCPSEDAAIIA
jgi:hypothetical protein